MATKETKKKRAKQKPQSEDHDVRTIAEQKVKQWLRDQSFRTKLVWCLLYGFSYDDFGAKELFAEITQQYEADIVTMANKPESALPNDELFMMGLIVEHWIWQKYY